MMATPLFAMCPDCGWVHTPCLRTWLLSTTSPHALRLPASRSLAGTRLAGAQRRRWAERALTPHRTLSPQGRGAAPKGGCNPAQRRASFLLGRSGAEPRTRMAES